jgi:hypothetical protein
VRGVDVVWVLRHGHIGDAFFDADAAEFLLGELQWRRAAREGCSGAAAGAAGGGGGAGTAAAAAGGRKGAAAEAAAEAGGGGPWGQAGSGPARPCEQAPGPGPGSEGDAPPGGAAAARRLGAALGPKWARVLPGGAPANVTVERHASVLGVFDTCAEALAALERDAAAAGSSGGSSSGGGGGDDEAWPVWLALGGPEGRHALGADLVVSAIGVEPATEWLPGAREEAGVCGGSGARAAGCDQARGHPRSRGQHFRSSLTPSTALPGSLARAPDGGLLVGANLRTSDPRVWAVGDCATLRREEEAPHFFQVGAF